MGFAAGMTFTNKGRRLKDKGETGQQIVFTKLQLGDGTYSGLSDPLTALISPKLDIEVAIKKLVPGQGALLGANLPMASIVTGFYWRELGLFALDPNEGEILYAYSNAGSSAEWLDPEGTADLRERSISIFALTGNATSITASFGSSVLFATQEDVAELAGAGRTTETVMGAYAAAASAAATASDAAEDASAAADAAAAAQAAAVAARAKVKSYTLAVASWTASGSTWQQTGTFPGLTDDHVLSWSWATQADGQACVDAEILLDASASGGSATLTWTAKNKPTAAIAVFVSAYLPVAV